MSKHIPRILVVGSINIDDAYYTTSFNAAGKADADLRPEFRLGGGAGNCVQAIHKLDEAFGTHSHVKLITRIGRPPKGDLRAEVAHLITTRILEESEIDYTDATRGESIMGVNAVIEDDEDRAIVRERLDNPSDMAYGIEETIEHHVRGADIVFVDPRKPRMGLMAARAANKFNKPLMVDWGEKEWSEDPELAAVHRELLERADILMLPNDAIVEGMENGVKNPDELFRRAQEQYDPDHILMSNGGDNVRALIHRQDGVINVDPVEGKKFTLAAGDTRNAAVLRAIAQGHDVLTAFKAGTKTASVKIRYPGMQWAEHIADDMQDHRMFRSKIDVCCNRSVEP